MTDPRLREALDRAAELSEAFGTKGATYLEGWAEAVEGWANEPTRAITIQREEAITKFCDALLGKRDA